MTGVGQSLNRAAKLKEIALSTNNAVSERIRAIELLGYLDGDAYDALADIAANGLSRNERINALEILARLSKRISVQPDTSSSEAQVEVKEPKPVKTKPVKRTRRAKMAELKITANGGLPEETFNEMLHCVKPLLKPDSGCSESEIKRQFRNLKGSVVETFLTIAIKKGIIKEVTPGTFELTSKEKT